ncbi:MAG: cytochrome C [Desulfobacteraceae bacterium]|nr:cytochrome C [Desulfobacteraceae bacterium]
MSTSDHEANGLAPDATTKKPEGSSYAVIVFFFIVGLAASLYVGWFVFPKLLYSEKKQPIDFNHKAHMGVVDKGCESCHFLREDGTFSGVPKLAQCKGCHESPQGDSKDEATFVNDYVAKGIEVPWKIYSKQPPCVFFSHVAHIKAAGMECTECHGDIGDSESMKPYKQNRISGYSQDIWGKRISGIHKNTWDGMKMNDCGKCHLEKMGDKGACFQCHK